MIERNQVEADRLAALPKPAREPRPLGWLFSTAPGGRLHGMRDPGEAK